MFSVDVVSTTSSSIAANVNFGVKQISILGHVVSEKGSPILRKRKPLEHRLRPTTYPIFNRFLERVAMLLNSFQIMRTLPNRYESSLGKSRNGHGEQNKQKAFEALKEALSGAPVLACFRVDAPTYVVTDASPVGLGAILLQDQQLTNPLSVWIPIFAQYAYCVDRSHKLLVGQH